MYMYMYDMLYMYMYDMLTHYDSAPITPMYYYHIPVKTGVSLSIDIIYCVTQYIISMVINGRIGQKSSIRITDIQRFELYPR